MKIGGTKHFLLTIKHIYTGYTESIATSGSWEMMHEIHGGILFLQ